MTEKKAAIFCSASYSIDSKYNQAARAVVRALCLSGYSIVTGGTVKGTMGIVSEEIVRCGGRHTGIIPVFMKDVIFPGLDEVIWTETMSERKEKMREGICLAIALPGGIGTLDELIETLVLSKLDKYRGRIIALNLDGFYNPLKYMLDHLVEAGMMERNEADRIFFADTVEELTGIL